ncbi:hypothetical protein [Solitalea longa]|nr:hypothetical protein [Solitalea longa]
MKKTGSLMSTNLFKVLIPMLIVLIIVLIAKDGYQFGQWLKGFINK